jgi:hypothetical protein
MITGLAVAAAGHHETFAGPVEAAGPDSLGHAGALSPAVRLASAILREFAFGPARVK